MGLYINPTNDESKIAWLNRRGTRTTAAIACDSYHEHIAAGLVPVCLVDNTAFLAAAVAYCLEEAQAFAYPDRRPKVWYLVPIASLSDAAGLSPETLAAAGLRQDA